MLNLKMKTDPIWVKNVVERNIAEILTDHAYCEQKAASTAISLIVQYPEHIDLVQKMIDLAQEELSHFSMVFEEIQKRGYTLGHERKDSYVNELLKFTRIKGRGREETLADKLLFAAMIEARSCERFARLSQHVDDTALAEFYQSLFESEARHHATYIRLAHDFASRESVQSRLDELAAIEALVIQDGDMVARMHS